MRQVKELYLHPVRETVLTPGADPKARLLVWEDWREPLRGEAGGRGLGNYRLAGVTLYSTVEPCAMCCGAIVHARVARLVYGAADPKAGAVESLFRLLQDTRLNHRVEVTAGVSAAECGSRLSEFFRSRRV